MCLVALTIGWIAFAAFSARGAPTTYFTDPDVLTVDAAFDGLRQPNAPIQRLWTGALWSEGPAWNSVGRFLVWSDIPNNRQLRWSEDDGHVSVFRSPSNNSNGNSFDYPGRQLSCEHLTRRVVRYELDGSATVLASSCRWMPTARRRSPSVMMTTSRTTPIAALSSSTSAELSNPPVALYKPRRRCAGLFSC